MSGQRFGIASLIVAAPRSRRTRAPTTPPRRRPTLFEGAERLAARKLHPEARSGRDPEPAGYGKVLAREEVPEHRADGPAVGTRRDIFAEGDAGLAGDEVVGIGSAAMWDHRHLIGAGMGRDAKQLR